MWYDFQTYETKNNTYTYKYTEMHLMYVDVKIVGRYAEI